MLYNEVKLNKRKPLNSGKRHNGTKCCATKRELAKIRGATYFVMKRDTM